MNPRYTPRARRDIDAIHEWIAQHNPRAATAVVARIRATAALLGRHPRLGRETDIPGVRVLPVVRYSYLLYFALDARDVVVIHVRHGARDAPRPSDLSIS